jgi:peptide/nickel transport system substrate-binding protein
MERRRTGSEEEGRRFLMRGGLAMRLARMRGSKRVSGVFGACCAVAGFAMVVAACGPVGSGTSSGVGTTPTSGGTASYATLPGFAASYIFPFTPGADFTATNSDNLQYLLYRPLYWFGTGTQPTLNPQLSLAYPPTYSGRTVTIKLRSYMWSNGQPVTAENVVFWINMEKAEESNPNNSFGGYVPGTFPDNVSNWHATSPTTLVMTLNNLYSHDWFTYNELSQITPMPTAWDVTASGKRGGCEQAISGCAAVYNYLTSTAVAPGNPAKWGSSAIWSIVDGPWRVVSATTAGEVTMKYNDSYSGPHAADHISEFKLLPFTSEQAEFNQLQDPGNNPVQYGYLPTVDAPVPPAGSQVGSNPASLTGYNLTVIYPWMLSYFPYNFNSPTVGHIFDQLYFRQAFQSLVDQEGVVSGPMHGYGKVTIGPVTDYPVTSYLSRSMEMQGDQWTLNPARAASLLSHNGWSVSTTGGTTFCLHPGTGPGECGLGIKAGTKLNFTLIYASGVDYMESQVKELVSNASLIGITITATPQNAEQVAATASGGAPGSWELAEWGSWTYSPDYLPTGEELFDNSPFGGFYNNATNNAYIEKTLTATTSTAFDNAMYTWQDYLAKQLPVVWTPNVATLVESASDLYIGPQAPTLLINPEDWYYLK